MENEKLTASTFTVQLEQDGLVRLTWLPNIEVTLAEARESITLMNTLTRGQRCPLLVDMQAAKSISRDARAYYASPANTAQAVALLVGSPVSRAIANFFLNLNQPPVPTKMFVSETEAIAWLKTTT